MSKLIFNIALIIVNLNAALPEKVFRNFIVGGENSQIKDYPYQVSLEDKFGDHFCGGSIISDKYILTAGHCLQRITALDVKVRVGSDKMSTNGTLYPVKRIIVHEEYCVRSDDVPVNDIALIELTKPIEFDETRKPIQLFKMNEKVRKGDKGVVSGWGKTLELHYDGQLQSVSVPIVSQEVCKNAYRFRPNQLEPYLPDGQFCAGYLGIGCKDSCQDDSGGPLAVEGRLAGIVSWGQGCADPDFPGVYTEIAYFRNWIRKHSDV